jgi:hypothetical protein
MGKLSGPVPDPVRRAARRFRRDPRLQELLLLGVFVAGSVPFWIRLLPHPAGDAVLYREGVVVWLGGGDPWLAGDPISRFAGTPLSLFVFAPSALLPVPLWAAVALAGSAAAAVYAVRALRLPIAWLFFPPLTAGIWTANPSVLMIALAVAALGSVRSPLGWVLGALGCWVKVLVVLPLAAERRWQALAVGGATAAVTILLAPTLWLHYLAEVPVISATLAQNTHHSAAWYRAPWLIPPAIVALLVLATFDRRAVAWLLIPALSPVVEYHWAVLMLPVAHPVLGLAAFVPDAAWPAVITLYVLVRWLARRRSIAAPVPTSGAAPEQITG